MQRGTLVDRPRLHWLEITPFRHVDGCAPFQGVFMYLGTLYSWRHMQPRHTCHLPLVPPMPFILMSMRSIPGKVGSPGNFEDHLFPVPQIRAALMSQSDKLSTLSPSGEERDGYTDPKGAMTGEVTESAQAARAAESRSQQIPTRSSSCSPMNVENSYVA
jgi:hypothetical protein